MTLLAVIGGPASSLQHVKQQVRAKTGIEPGPRDLASNRNSAAAVFLGVYRHVWVVNNVILARLSLDGRFRFTAAEASHSDITNSRY